MRVLPLILLLAAPASAEQIRFATFNASLNRGAAGELRADLMSGEDSQIKTVAEIIQRAAPDVLLINEFDYDATGPALTGLFQQNYLARPQANTGAGAAQRIDYGYSFTAPSNTGLPSGFDLNRDGRTGGAVGSFDYANDAQGFGLFPGQYGMAVFSRHKILYDRVRTFQTFLWNDMPDARLPRQADGAPWYDAATLEALRLSSKSHWDIPIEIEGEVVHFLTSHPTPPVFDGAEDRNGLRNADEIRFWADYIDGKDYFYDDQGGRGGLAAGAKFVIAGDLNADPLDGDSADQAARQLTAHPLIDDDAPPTSAGGAEAAAQGGANLDQAGDPARDTADFDDRAGIGPGNLRVDYVLASRTLKTVDSGVSWPSADDPLSALTGAYPFPSSDHRLVWRDVEVSPAPVPAPGAAGLLLAAMAAIGLFRRRG